MNDQSSTRRPKYCHQEVIFDIYENVVKESEAKIDEHSQLTAC